MAHKGAAVAGKRKEAPLSKSDRHKPAKKTKLSTPLTGSDSADDDDQGFGGFSGSESDSHGADLGNKKNIRASSKGNLKVQDKAKRTETSNGTAKGQVFEKGQNSRESHARQKQLVQERKASKPLADELQRLKKLWEKLRRKSHVPREDRKDLLNELFSIITGRVKEFVLKHDAVRAVQTAVKYSTAAQRREIAKELQGTYAQLAESRYAKFLIGKLLVTGDKEIRDLIIPEFYGKVRRLINHPEASWILDDIYRGVATADQKAIMLREWYGPEFALFKPQDGAKPNADLSLILADEPSKRSTAMKYLLDMVNQLIQKQMTGFTMLHDAMLQYFVNVRPESEEAKEFLEIVKGDEAGDLLRNMAFTKPGARLSCLLLAYGSAKDRKQLMKAYKDTFRLMCGDVHGHLVILAAYDLIDDTVFAAKAIFPEILGKDPAEAGNIIFLANDPSGRTAICYLLDPMSKSLFSAALKADLEILEEIHEIRKTTSKKDANVRRKELVAALSAPLLAAIAASPMDLVSTATGCQFVADALLYTVGDKTEALAAVASVAAGDPAASAAAEVYPPPPVHISLTPHGGKLFRSLIAGGRFDKQTGRVQSVENPLRFADTFYPVVQDHIVTWATGPSSFVVVSLLESDDFSARDELQETLLANRDLLEKAASGGLPGRDGGSEESKVRGKKGKGKGAEKAEAKAGNSGAKLLLEKLQK